MNAVVLRLYMHEGRRVHGALLYEWLLEQARKSGIHGCSVFRSIAGYGRHGVLREQQFFELAGQVPVVAEFVATAEQAQQLIALLRQEHIDLVYSQWPTEFAATGEG